MADERDNRFTLQWLQELVAHPERTMVEFKREWYDLDNKAGKAKFIKPMLALANALALANTVSPAERGFLVVGVDDPKDGGSIRGVSDPPKPETVVQIIASNTAPPVRLECHRVANGSLSVDVLEVHYTPAGIHYAVSDLPELSRKAAYIRRGPTTDIMEGTEIEAVIRAQMGLMTKGQYQGQVYQMISQNQAGWDFPRAHALL